MKPAEVIDRLTAIAEQARYHPEPGYVVQILAQLLLDLAVSLKPVAEKYAVLLQASGALDEIELSVLASQAEIETTADASKPAEDASQAQTAFDPAQDTTGTA